MSIQSITPADTLGDGFREKYNETIKEIPTSYEDLENGTIRVYLQGGGHHDISIVSFYLISEIDSIINDLKDGVPTEGNTLNKLYTLIQSVGIANEFIGPHDASGGNVPTTGSGTAGAIMKGDFWRVDVAGTIIGVTPFDELNSGDLLFSKIDGASTGADFFATEGNLSDATSLKSGLLSPILFDKLNALSNLAEHIEIDTSSFSGNLTSAVDTVQKLAVFIDEWAIVTGKQIGRAHV